MIKTPTTEQIKNARLDAGHTQSQAANVVYTNLRTWQRWESGTSVIPLGLWELYLIKTDQHQ